MSSNMSLSELLETKAMDESKDFIHSDTGDYHFFIFDQEYKLVKLNYFDQIRVIRTINSVEEAEGNTDPAFSEEMIEAQRNLFGIIFHRDGDTSYKLIGSDDNNIFSHVKMIADKYNIKPLTVSMALFMNLSRRIVGNFTDSGDETPLTDTQPTPTPQNLDQKPVEKSQKIPMKTV